MEHYDPEAHRALALTYNLDVGVGAQGFDALCLWLLGYPDQALARARDALRLAEQQSHPFSLVFAHIWSALLHGFRRDAEATATFARKGAELAEEHGFSLFVAWSAPLQGWALAVRGRQAEGAERIRQGLSDAMATGSELYRPCFRGCLAESLGAAGNAEAGLQLLDEELALAERDERFYDAELLRLKGELLLRSATAGGEAESCCLEALGVAREQQARSLELRAALSLARLWRSQGKRNEARELLTPVYNGFTEGFDTLDLQDAKILIGELETDRPMATVGQRSG
jgi:predicted ATPase